MKLPFDEMTIICSTHECAVDGVIRRASATRAPAAEYRMMGCDSYSRCWVTVQDEVRGTACVVLRLKALGVFTVDGCRCRW